MQVVTSKTKVCALDVHLTHKCVVVDEEASKASREANLEEEISLLKEDLVKERRLKDGVMSKGQFVMDKESKFSSQLEEAEEAVKHSLEDARNPKKRVVTFAKERDVTLHYKEATLNERDSI